MVFIDCLSLFKPSSKNCTTTRVPYVAILKKGEIFFLFLFFILGRISVVNFWLIDNYLIF